MKVKIFLFVIFFVIFDSIKSNATHNRAGEITFRQINNLTIEVTITTYTKASSIAADRDSLEFFWGDNTSEFIKRDNSLTKFVANDVKINYYIAQHTYPGAATYTMYFTDPNRVSTILNINYPNSVDIPFFLSTTLTLLNQQFQGPNNSVILLQPPLDIACAGKKFIHNPNGYDPDNDSLVYELAVPLQAVNLPVPGYKYPDEISPNPNNKISINPVTGEFIWEVPVIQGEYNIAIKISEYRNGILINTVLRDMQILVRTCINDPPSIIAEPEICVVAGEKIDINILVNDINNGQKVRLFATGGPFTVDNPGVLNTPTTFNAPPFTSTFSWQTNCNHISKDYYQIVLRAVDNYFGDSSGLATLKTIRIKVVGPPPENPDANYINQSIVLEWDKNYACNEVNSKNFTGFAVYRSEMSIPFEIDTCFPGLANSGYTKIAIGVRNSIADKYIFRDTNVKDGYAYCYRVVAEFSFFTANNIPYTKIEGLASDEVCVQINRNVPLITQVSVEKTGSSDGIIRVSWSKPSLQALDTSQFSPPYTFDFYRSDNNQNFEWLPDKRITTQNFETLTDTTFLDAGLNTLDKQYYYYIHFKSSQSEVGSSQKASSLFLQIEPSDQSLRLLWQADVPWSNFEYDIYQDISGTFTYVGTSKESFYQLQNLVNNKEYCFRITSKGTYNFPGFKDTLYNRSQERCEVPLDNVPPCKTTLSVNNPCDLIKSGTSIHDLFNQLEWKNPADICPKLAEDAIQYNIYFANDSESDYTKIMTVEDLKITSYTHYTGSGLSGCYYITTVDKLGNESLPSNIVCIDNCPLYLLPNTFTPNGDSKNDLFEPITNYFISRIDLQVFNQWGNLVFTTTDPKILWDGKNIKGKDLADGVYHYTCRVFVKQVDGAIAEEEPLEGFIQIIR